MCTRSIANMSANKTNELAIVLAESSAGAPRAGSELGPRSILDSGLSNELRSHFETVHICEIDPKSSADANLLDPNHAGMKRPRTVSKATHSVHEHVYTHASQERLVLTLGGDHSNAIGTLTGTSRATRERFNEAPAVICVDAHVSINPPELSPSGNIHGMPLAFATGLARCREEGIFDWIEDEHLVDMKRLVYIGTRDVDDGERELIDKHGIKDFTNFTDIWTLLDMELTKVLAMALDYVGSAPIHLSCDIDALDPEWASSAGHLVPGGLSLDQVEVIARVINNTGRLIALDLVEVNPTINPDQAQRTIDSACTLIRGALGLSE